ncbi:MAG TPA: CopD family protein, partial [Solirubrobacteraceae bacterium]|nr:CopD family protein [Solirubrobacteraceae bacterium]
AIYQAQSGRRIAVSVSFPAALEMALRPAYALARGSYRVEWHSVSTDDGHELEGSFSFGVQAPALGGATTTVAGPLAGLGWLRTLLRAAFYPALFLFAGALMLRTLLGGRERDLWLLPGGVRRQLGGERAAAVVRTERSLVLDAGLLATALAAAVVLVETQIAAGDLSPRAIHAFLLTDTPGLARVGLILLLALAVTGAVMAPAFGGVVAALALGELALSGHADSASPRALAVAVDWIHLLAGALWLGGIAVIAWIWVRRLRNAGPEVRLAVMGELLPRFGRVALPAFIVVASTGILNAYIQLRHPSLLWESSYGRTLLVKSALVGVIALVSYTHVFRLRPRLLAANPHPDAAAERRHWRLLGSEAVLGVGLAVAVAVLVAFPLPREVAAARTLAARPLGACNPCVLPLPTADQLAVATNAGSEIVAGWLRHSGGNLKGQVRVLDIDGQPASTPFEIEGTAAVSPSCGPGCRAFTIRGTPPAVRVVLSPDRGERSATLPTRWRPAGSNAARRILDRAQAVMRHLRSVRQIERVNSVPGLYALSDGRARAPDRWAYTTYVVRPPAPPQREDELVAIGARQWTRHPGGRWQLQPQGGTLPFRTPTLFTWSSYAEAVRLIGVEHSHGRAVATLALMDPGTPAWWTLRVELATGRVLDAQLITSGHFISTQYSQFNSAPSVLAPRSPGA